MMNLKHGKPPYREKNLREANETNAQIDCKERGGQNMTKLLKANKIMTYLNSVQSQLHDVATQFFLSEYLREIWISFVLFSPLRQVTLGTELRQNGARLRRNPRSNHRSLDK